MKLFINPSFIIICLIFVLIDSVGIIALVLIAAAIHEFGHFAALWMVKAPVEKFDISIFGGEIRLKESELLSYGQELFATAAGPAVNMAAAFAAAAMGAYLFSGINMILGIFNLLPIRPLDGGRIMLLILSYIFDPIIADRAVHIVTIWCGAVLLAAVCVFILNAGVCVSLGVLAAWIVITILDETEVVKKLHIV